MPAASIAIRNHITVSGTGTQTLLFAHGFGCDQRMWRYVTPAFKERYKIVLFDYVGAGRSDVSAYQSSRYASLQGYSRDLLEVIEEAELTDVILICHSVSCSIGYLAAIQRPEKFRRLISIAPSPSFLNHPPDYTGGFELSDLEGLIELIEKNPLGWAGTLAPMLVPTPEKKQVAQELEASFCSIAPHIAKEFARVTFFSDNRDDLRKVNVPSLILQCQYDALAPLEVGYYLHSHLKRSTLAVLPVEGHCPHMSHPEQVIQAIQSYLDTVDAA